MNKGKKIDLLKFKIKKIFFISIFFFFLTELFFREFKILFFNFIYFIDFYLLIEFFMENTKKSLIFFAGILIALCFEFLLLDIIFVLLKYKYHLITYSREVSIIGVFFILVNLSNLFFLFPFIINEFKNSKLTIKNWFILLGKSLFSFSFFIDFAKKENIKKYLLHQLKGSFFLLLFLLISSFILFMKNIINSKFIIDFLYYIFNIIVMIFYFYFFIFKYYSKNKEENYDKK